MLVALLCVLTVLTALGICLAAGAFASLTWLWLLPVCLVGDFVVAFNGQSVSRTEDVLAIRRTLRVGDKVPILIWREGEYMELTIEMMAQ